MILPVANGLVLALALALGGAVYLDQRPIASCEGRGEGEGGRGSMAGLTEERARLGAGRGCTRYALLRQNCYG